MERQIPQSLINDIRRYGLEMADNGFVIPRANVMIGGVFDYELHRGGRRDQAEVWSSHNLVVTEGRNHFLDVVLHGATPVSPWYIGLFEGNYVPVAGDTAATFPASATECTAYDEATRVAYNEADAASKVTTNAATPVSSADLCGAHGECTMPGGLRDVIGACDCGGG